MIQKGTVKNCFGKKERSR